MVTNSASATAEPASASAVRQLSMKAVIEVMLRRGPVSRAELARLTQLSKQTISEVVRALEIDGWIGVSGQVQGALGRSAVAYELREDAAIVLGIDLGGTKLHAALANSVGAVLAEAVEPTDQRGGAQVIGQIGAVAERLLEQSGRRGRAVSAAAMGCPGVVDPRTGAIEIAPNIPGLAEMDVVAALERRLGCRTAIENDVNLGAKGEQWQGSCRDVRSFAFVALGTGIGMGIVADGRLVRGMRGAAGEIAFLPLGGDPFDSRHHRHGALEEAVASRAILDRYRGHGGAAADDVREVFDRLAAGDPAAAAALDETARLLTQALVAIRAILDPARIVLGGSIGTRPELIARVRALSDALLSEPLPIAPSALGTSGTVMGAVGTALEQLYADLFGLPGLPAAFAPATCG